MSTPMLEPVTQVRSLETSDARARRGGTPSATVELPDLLLIERARGGEERAIEALIRRYSRRMFRVARSVLPDEDAADAAVQDAYLAAFGDLNRYTPTGKFAAWLTRLAFNQARALRASARSGPLAAPRQLAPAPAPTPASAAADEAQERRELEHAIGRLPEVFRTVFVLRAVEEMSVEEVAESLAIPVATVRTRFFRAKGLLREALSSEVDRAIDQAFAFAGERCNRITERVLAQVALSRK